MCLHFVKCKFSELTFCVNQRVFCGCGRYYGTKYYSCISSYQVLFIFAKYGTVGARVCVLERNAGPGSRENFPSRRFLLTLLAAPPRVRVFLHEGTVPSSGELQSRQSGLFLSLSPSLTPGLVTALHSSLCSRHARSEGKKESNRVGDTLTLWFRRSSFFLPSSSSSYYSHSSAQASFSHVKVPLARRRRRRPVLLWRPRVLL